MARAGKVEQGSHGFLSHMSSDQNMNERNQPVRADTAFDVAWPKANGSPSGQDWLTGALEERCDVPATSTELQRPPSRLGSCSSVVGSPSEAENQQLQRESHDFRSAESSDEDTQSEAYTDGWPSIESWTSDEDESHRESEFAGRLMLDSSSSDEDEPEPQEGTREPLPVRSSNTVMGRTLNDPDSVMPAEPRLLVDSVFRKALEDCNNSRSMALFCARVINVPSNKGFYHLLFRACQDWVINQIHPSNRLLIPGGEYPVEYNPDGRKWEPFLTFLAYLVDNLAEHLAGSSRLARRTRHLAVLFCQSCTILATSEDRRWFQRVFYVCDALFAAGRTAQQAAPEYMETLMSILRGFLDRSSFPEEMRAFLQKVLEYRDAGWTNA